MGSTFARPHIHAMALMALLSHQTHEYWYIVITSSTTQKKKTHRNDNDLYNACISQIQSLEKKAALWRVKN